MVGLVGDIPRHEGQPTFISIARNKAYSVGCKCQTCRQRILILLLYMLQFTYSRVRSFIVLCNVVHPVFLFSIIHRARTHESGTIKLHETLFTVFAHTNVSYSRSHAAVDHIHWLSNKSVTSIGTVKAQVCSLLKVAGYLFVCTLKVAVFPLQCFVFCRQVLFYLSSKP